MHGPSRSRSRGASLTGTSGAPRRSPAARPPLEAWPLALLLLVSPLAGACGGEPDESAQQESRQGESEAQEMVDACSLLTKAEVETALGAAVDEPYGTERDAYAPGGRGVMTQCNYDRGLTDGVAVVVRQFTGEGFTERTTSAEWVEELEAEFAEQRADPDLADGVPPGGARPVDIPGHAAVAVLWDGFVTLSVRIDGQQRRQVMVTAPTLEIARGLASTALSRLP